MKAEELFTESARVFRFIRNVVVEAIVPPYEWKGILEQSYIIGVKTIFLIGFVSLVAGYVFAKQSLPSLQSFGAESWLPSLVAIGIIRSLGPLITSLVCAGKLGSSIGAELSSMNVTEQIDAMDVSGISPFRYLVVTRVAAVTLMLPILVAYSDAIGLYGAFLLANKTSETSLQLYFTQVFARLSFEDLITTMVKPFFFGFSIGVISSYAGYYSKRATAGVGKAANTSVVVSMISIFIIDFISIQVIQFFRNFNE
jgi:phospholipid/cholesterol/gamma-HCH transport system permease protein